MSFFYCLSKQSIPMTPIEPPKKVPMNYDLDPATKQYIKYKPQRPKCPIQFKRFIANPDLNRDTALNHPMYHYPAEEKLRQQEKEWFQRRRQHLDNVTRNVWDVLESQDENGSVIKIPPLPEETHITTTNNNEQ